MRSNFLRVCEYWALSWVGLCLFLAQAVDDATQSGLTLIMLVMMPLIAIMGYLAAHHRCALLMQAKPSDLTSPEDFELKIRFLMEHHVEELSKSVNNTAVVVESSVSSETLDGIVSVYACLVVSVWF
jgi:hypothetical protein